MTDVPLRDYTDNAIEALRRELSARVLAVEDKANAANEWRAAMNDRERNFAREPEISRRLEALAERTSHLERAKANLDGRMAMFAIVPLLLSVAGLIVALTK